MTAKKPTATHSPLVLVRLILSGGAPAGVVCDWVFDAGGAEPDGGWLAGSGAATGAGDST